jgi:hypothetical protein
VFASFDGRYYAESNSSDIIMIVVKYNKGRTLTQDEICKIKGRLCLGCGRKILSFTKFKMASRYVASGLCEGCILKNREITIKVKLKRNYTCKKINLGGLRMKNIEQVERIMSRINVPLTEDELIGNENYYQYELKIAELKGAMHGRDEYLINLVNEVISLTGDIYGQQGIVEGWHIGKEKVVN